MTQIAQIVPTVGNMAARDLAYRVSGLPRGVTPDDAASILDSFFDDNRGQKPRAKVHSLGLDPLSGASQDNITVATVSFGNRVPDQLRTATTYYGTAKIRFRQRFLELSLTIDSDFLGFTPLNLVDDESQSIDCIAVSGLAGHAFGSWKQRGGSFMWLRDSSDWRTRNVRVLLYGYDTSMVGSESFQDIDDIGKRFGDALLDVRYLEVSTSPGSSTLFSILDSQTATDR